MSPGATPAIAFLATLFVIGRSTPPASGEPLWAYGFNTPPQPGAHAATAGPPTHAPVARQPLAPQLELHRIAGSPAAFSLVDARDGHNVVDWFPDEHPPLSSLLMHGPASMGPNGYACAYCHLPNGRGKPENANVAGLPEAYVIRQLHDLRDGLRSSADPRKANARQMVALARAMSEAEITEFARFVSALPQARWTRVVESPVVPPTEFEAGMYVPTSDQLTQPINGRIVEVPENPAETRYRNPHSGFIAYVPPGSVAKGRALVTTGARTVACATCHGPNLEGVGDIPGIAGRSPTYLARQLYDFQRGTRHGVQSAPMQPVTANLTESDILAITAYVATLEPRPALPPAKPPKS